VSLTLDSWVDSDIGHVRTGNEDSAFAGPRLVAVADGMGGHAAGEVASQIAITTLAPLDEDATGADILGALREAVDEANATLRDMVAADHALEGMGTTVTALLSSGRRLGLVHIGDSRAYLLRDGVLSRITRDHTYVQELIDAGQITEDQAATHPQRSLLLRALDGRDDVEPEVRVREAVLGDRYLLCSDGLSGVVSDETIREVLCSGTPKEAVRRLVELALKAGGPDNVTVLVADVVDSAEQGQPQVAGAVAEPGAGAGRPSAAARLSAAGRAALAKAGARRGDDEGGRDARELAPAAGTARPARLLRPLVVVPLAVVMLLAVASAAGMLYLHRQYYVGVDSGRIAVFRGVPGSVAGVSLQTVQERFDPVEVITESDLGRAREGIPAADRADAENKARALQHRPVPPGTPATPPPVSSSVPPPSPGAPPTPAPVASP